MIEQANDLRLASDCVQLAPNRSILGLHTILTIHYLFSNHL